MAISFQYNKTSLQGLEKDLKMRQRTLPTLQSKETALRLEVKRAKQELEDLDREVEQRIQGYDQMIALWGEFDTSLIHVDDVRMSIRKIAGVRVPVLDEVVYTTKPFSLFSSPKWFADGFEQLKAIAEVGIRQEFVRRKVELLEYARKKTTQKVNLFEKVQIPGYQDAIRKIKRFMEDEENLSKSSQKIVKSKREAEARAQEERRVQA
ncbi:MAG: V-type ATP synthase subunit D [Paludibacteraceae bacterium]|nr:V-type ATP synthase subunit D [Paludibacteraceae bacterium]